MTVAAGRLRQALAEMKKTPTWHQIVEPRDAVFARFQPIFQPEHVPALTEEEFRPFFYLENNHHWSGLFRQVNRVCQDMTATRRVLSVLVDESRPIEARLNEAQGSILGLGKAIMTAILTVAYPTKYGVWNNTSESGLIELQVWPETKRGDSFGAQYARINEALTVLAKMLGVDLWTLDALWWHALGESESAGSLLVESPAPVIPAAGGSPSDSRFGLERHLHDFLLYNWDRLDLGRDWSIYSEPNHCNAGYEFACSVGRIDLLARHRTDNHWLVVELKRNETSDSVVGQVLRYIGWVRHHLAAPGEEVHGLIIAREGDDSVKYAVSAVPNLRFATYEVSFCLREQRIATDDGKRPAG